MNRSFSQSRDVQITVSLSKLISSKRNPRRVKPERDAHRRMVASIRAHGLLAPLVVRADDASTGDFKVIAGNRRLAALRDVYKDSTRPPKVLCVLRSVDDDTADALALAENFVREPMHPLDEAEAFAKLAREEAKGVESIASEFGVSQPYVRQRMKLATLAEPVKAAYRQGAIDTATAEAFASVPPDRQLEVWQEVAGKPPTSDDLKDGQLATTFTHQALAVREAVLKDAAARRRILAIVLHEKVRSEALAIRHDANGSTVHADNAEGFTSPALDGIRKRRAELDPLHDKHYVEDHAAYDAFQALSDKKLDALIDLLTVECITAHLQRRTELVWRLAAELGVEVRRFWRPDERWLSGYQKIQLAHLIGELRGPVYAKAAELKKKSELVADLAKLFTEAAEGRMEDAKVAAKFNAWLPSNLRDEPKAEATEHASAA